jgi:hypothetical protein|tara:strand:- start:247 stop:507 length:261 start_codon:yes stop_codon:yes gene_type:complete
MGTKVIHTGELAALPLLTEVLEADDGRQLLTDRLLNNLSTSGAGDVSDVSEISYLIHEIVQYALFVNSQDYDIDAAAQALLDAQGE